MNLPYPRTNSILQAIGVLLAAFWFPIAGQSLLPDWVLIPSAILLGVTWPPTWKQLFTDRTCGHAWKRVHCPVARRLVKVCRRCGLEAPLSFWERRSPPPDLKKPEPPPAPPRKR